MADNFYSYPPEETVKPPEFPPRPDLFDEVAWAPYVSPEDAKLAWHLWWLPDSILGNATSLSGPFRRPISNDRTEPMYALAKNVYDHLMQQHLIPPSEDDWEQRWKATMLHDKTWSLQEIFDPAMGLRAQAPEGQILVQGHDVLSAPWWTVSRLRAELHNRGLDNSGRSAELRRRLYDDEGRSQGYTLLPRSDLWHWGANRNDKFTFKLSETSALKPLDMYTWAIMLSPYNPVYWLGRAYCHYLQAFFDLAIGDAYRAQLLCEVLVDSKQRNRQPGLYLRICHAIQQHILASHRDAYGNWKGLTDKLREPNGIYNFVPTIRKALHNIISLSLSALGSWKDYSIMEHYLKERLSMSYYDTSAFERRHRVLVDVANENHERRNEERLFYHEKKAGNVNGGKEYPYEANDVDRTTNVSLNFINSNVFQDFPKCEARASAEGDSLCVMATGDIEKGTLIFAEEPSIRGHLTVTRLEQDSLPYESKQARCDNCRKLIGDDVLDRYTQECSAITSGTHAEACMCHMPSTTVPLHFCPADPQQGTTCLQIARESYHHRACGKNWKWLHDAMRPGIMRWDVFKHFDIQNPKEYELDFFTHTNELHGTALSLLLREVFDITLMKRERTGDVNLLAHEIDELAMLEDPKSWSDSWFPFTFAANIRVPFDILLQLGVDIFSDLSFDTWVIQIVLRKLIVNAVPWDERWRGHVEQVKRNKLPRIKRQRNMLKQKESFNVFDPAFQTLYLFSGFSLFNHACRGRHNANWGYDETVPNRVLVWATEDIPRSTEIRIPYKFKPMSSTSARRFLGKDCQCSLCRDGDADNSSSSENDNDPDDDIDDNCHYANNQNNDGDDGDGGNGSPDYGPGDDDSDDDDDDDDDSDGDTEKIPSSEIPQVKSSTSARVLRQGSTSGRPLNASSLLSNPYRPATPARPQSSRVSPISKQVQPAQQLQFVKSSPPGPSGPSGPSQAGPSQLPQGSNSMPPPPPPPPQPKQPKQPQPAVRKTPKMKITRPDLLSESMRRRLGVSATSSDPKSPSKTATSTSEDTDSDESGRSQGSNQSQDGSQSQSQSSDQDSNQGQGQTQSQNDSQSQGQNQNQDQDQDQDQSQGGGVPKRKRPTDDQSLMARFQKILRRGP